MNALKPRKPDSDFCSVCNNEISFECVITNDDDNHDIVSKAVEDEKIDKRTSSADRNVIGTYLKEITKWPILTREKEQIIAKLLFNSKEQKQLYFKKWFDTFVEIISFKNTARADDKQSRTSDKLYHSIELLKKYKKINLKVKNIEKKLLADAQHFNKKNELAREKALYLIELQEIINQFNILDFYKHKTLQKLSNQIIIKEKPKTKKELFHIIRNIIKYESEEKQTKDTLVKSNLRLVVGIAKRYINRGLPLSDLIQEGNIGLLKAIEKFDFRLGNRLSTYASWWIRQTIIRAIEDKSSTIRVPVYVNEKIKKLTKYNSDNTGDYESDVEKEFAGENIYSILQVMKEPLSLETPFGDDGSNLHECIPDNMPNSPIDDVLKNQLFEEAEEILKTLPPREEKILRLRFGLGIDSSYTLQEIGNELGVSRERIRQLEATAIKRIRESKSFNELRPYISN